jgi:hypothetical protein
MNSIKENKMSQCESDYLVRNMRLQKEIEQLQDQVAQLRDVLQAYDKDELMFGEFMETLMKLTTLETLTKGETK